MISKGFVAAFVTPVLILVIAAPAFPGEKPTTPPGQGNSNPGKGSSTGNNGKGGSSEGAPAGAVKAKITWDLPDADIAAALFGSGSVSIPFHTSADIENVGFWLSPSLEDALEILTEPFDVLHAGVVYSVDLALKGARPTRTIGGTLHLVPVQQSQDGLRRTYAEPLPINVKFGAEGGGAPTKSQAITVVSSTSYSGEAIAPLQIVSIFGFGIGPGDFTPAIVENGKVTDYLADVQVFFDGTAAPILFASATQLNVVVPSDVAGKTQVTLTVTYKGSAWEVQGIPVVDAMPEIFAMNGLGHGLAAALDSEGRLISESNPVAPGEWISLFGTGVGLWRDGFVDGTVVGGQELPVPKKPVEIEIGGAKADVLYIGGAPGMVSGFVQFNVVVPTTMPDIDLSSSPPAARIVLTSGGHPSKAEVYIYLETPAP